MFWLTLLGVLLMGQEPAGGFPGQQVWEALLKREAQGPQGDPALWEANRALARLHLEKAQLLLNAGWSQAAQEEVRKAQKALERLAQGERPYAGQAGLQEWAYVCRTDGSAQPYFVAVPEEAPPPQGWPMVLFLHGYDPAITKINPWVFGEQEWSLFTQKGVLLVIPYGRRNSDFLRIGEVDCLRVLEEATRLFPVDADRVYVMGASMGGYGAWNLALHYPDRFAAVAPIAAHSDFYLWERRDRNTTPRFKRTLLSMENPLDLAANALHLGIYFQHGGEDTLVVTEHSRQMAQRFQALGYPFEYEEIPEGSHYIYWEPQCYERALKRILGYRRSLFPERVRYVTYHLRYHRAYWVRIEQVERWGQRAEVEAEIRGPGTVVVRTENVAGLTLALPPQVKGPSLTLLLNGRPAYRGPLPPDRRRTLWLRPELQPKAGELVKTPDLCGPAREAVNGPFLVVFGTGEPSLRQKALRWVQEWYLFADGLPPVKADTELTEEDWRGRNLILFGEPSTHRFLARVAAHLPLRILGPGHYEVGGRTFRGPEVGLVLLYPNPLAPQRYLLIYSGAFYGEGLPIEHKFDLLPDFLVFETRLLPDGTNRFLAAGFFDQRWQWREELTEWGDEPR